MTATKKGYRKDLSERHIRMIALGGTIGTGLFLGAGLRLQMAGPSLVFAYALCGLCVFMILRALGELVVYRPASGSFVSYAQEFLGSGAAYAMGWFYALNLLLTGIVDITAVAVFLHYWPLFQDVPQWVIALCALCLVGGLNLIGVKYFGEVEFWLALIKVGSLSLFLAIGGIVLAHAFFYSHQSVGLPMITANGGFFPRGWGAPLFLLQGVIFAYASSEFIGIAASECANPRDVVPKAINGVIWRILFFYVGSIALLALLLPFNQYMASESPFVTFFKTLGVPMIADIMNIVVLMAAFSSLNSCLYSTSRVLRALAETGAAPKSFLQLSPKSRIPFIAIAVTLFVYLIGVILNYLIPNYVFELALGVAAIGVIGAWATILLCNISLHRSIVSGKISKTDYPMPGSPVTNWLTLGFLGLILISIGFDYPNGTMTLSALPFLGIALWLSWRVIVKHKEKTASSS
ncbi:amino acid permease [Acetobacteraceae bacterium]|nr:amino acid permease [Acetobacteraceae bacterium]